MHRPFGQRTLLLAGLLALLAAPALMPSPALGRGEGFGAGTNDGIKRKGFLMQKALQKDITKVVRRLKNNYHPQKIVLFGSASRGKAHPASDIDFLVVKESRKPSHERIRDIFRLLRGVEREYPLDFIVLTPGELKTRVELGDFFVKDILAEGRLLYESK